MKLRENFLQFNSKQKIKMISAQIGADETIFAELMKIFLYDNFRSNQIATWVVRQVSLDYPFQIKPYFPALLQKIQEPNIHDAFKRNIIRIMEEIELPDEFLNEIYGICYNFILSKEAIAIRAFSMKVCYRVVLKIPELKEELQYTLEDILMRNEGGSAGINHRAKEILAKLKKIK